MHKLLSGRRILVVEDEMLVLMMIEMMLDDLGCQHIVSATNVAGALAELGEQDFDLAMLDMNLGGIDSCQVADRMDALNLPFMFCTGNSTGDKRPNAREHPLLRKPFDSAHLRTALNGLLAERDGLLPAA